ncbi:ATP-binding protein [Amycolatopsis jejuensis]|uniref:ATP-binding protein n=1 Tax=Amycolatopsis jejuensis TaxID=330084 RepID=UPI0005259B4F|nr:AAA family ATPase [Amycolatopsis jejuensis]
MVEPLPFVGRAAVLREVAAVLAAARAGRGGLVLLTGAGGAGKTRIAAEVAGTAQDFRTVWAWCPPDAFGPWAQILRDLVADVQGGRIAQSSPELRAIVTGQVQSRPGNPEESRRQLARDVAAVLRAESATRPLLLVLDDVHEADASSQRLLAEVSATIRTAPVVVVATARDDDYSWHGRTQTRAMLLGRALCIPVGPLDDADVAQLVTAATGQQPDADEVREIVARTGGEAFFVTELVRHGSGVPASVRAVVRARTAGLRAECATALTAASVLGVRFRLDVLADLTGVALPGVRALLGEASAAGLLGELDAGTAAFRHQLLRDAVYDAIPAAERAELHAKAADVLASHAERGRDLGPAQVAQHYLQAGPEHALAAARFARLAGDQAAALLAHDEAVAWYERAREAAPGDDPELLLACGTARLGAGDRVGARADFLAAARLSDARPDLLARAALGLGSGATGIEVDLLDHQQVDLLERARAALPEEDSALRAAVIARLSVATTLLEPDDQRLALAEEAVRVARRVGDPAALAQALAALCDAKPGPANCTDRLGWADEIIALARGLRDPVLELLGRRLRLVALLETGAVADAEVLAFDRLAQVLDQPFYLWYPPLWRGMRALLEGRYDDAAELLDRTEELGRESGSANAIMLAATQRWCLLSDDGDRAALARFTSQVALDEIPGLWPQVTLALLAAQFDRPAEARDRLSAVAPRLPDAPRDSEWLPMLAQAAETIALTGPHPLARPLYDWLLPYADLFVVEGIGAAIRGPVHRHLALLAHALGDPHAAAKHRDRAVAAAESIGATALAARIRTESGSTPGVDTFARDGEVWLLRFDSREVRLPDAKGLQDLARLLAQPGVAVAAIDLATPVRPPVEGDLGEVVDATARAAYRRRLKELDAASDAADAAGDAPRSAKIAEEREALLHQLSAAYAIGGRARRAGIPAERARTAVTARIHAAIERIGRAHPDLGRHLRNTVRTGTRCVYEPETAHAWHT